MDRMTQRMQALATHGVPVVHLEYPVAGLEWFEHYGGREGTASIWNHQEWTNRDDFFLVAGACFHVTSLLGRLPSQNDWRAEFDVAGLFLAKMIAQSVRSIDLVTRACSYVDAFTLLRPLAARANLLLLCALEPGLFDRWLREPTLPEFREREIEKELANCGIDTMGYVYDLASELTHSHFQAVGETGFLEQGIFPVIPAVSNRVYVTAKFLLGLVSWTTAVALRADFIETAVPEDVQGQYDLQKYLHADVLHGARWDHLFATMAEDRHWVKLGKSQWKAGGTVDWTRCEDVIQKCRRSRQPKRVGKRYQRLLEEDEPSGV